MAAKSVALEPGGLSSKPTVRLTRYETWNSDLALLCLDRHL